MRKVWQQLMLLFTICLLFAQALFGSITVSATANEPLTIILTTEGEPYIEGHIALNPVTIQMATSSIDSEGMQVEWSVNEGDTWEIFDMMDPLVLTDAGDYSIWFRIIGQPTISKHTIRIAGSQPSLLSASNSIIYVNLNTVEGSNDGTNWVNAFDNLQSALDKAQSGDQIWIAQGTYTPTRKVDGNDPRSATFQMKNGVAIYGGFKGDETTLAERDFEKYKTILSGALPNGSSAYHVFFHSYFLELDKTAVLDGVTITKGNANGSTMDLYGGGMFNISRNSPTLTNVNFYGNKAGLQGGGLYNHSESNPILTNVTFTENEAGFQGGAIYNYNSGPTFQDVIFEKNKTTGSQSEGGGIYNYGSSPILTNVTFIENEAENKGGAMSNTKQSNPSLTGVSFDGNKALISGKGGGMYNSESSPMLTNVQFNKNVASYDGGGIANEMSNPTLIDVLFTSNTASSYGAGMYNASSDPSLDNVIFIGNETFMYGGGMYNDNSSPTLTNVTFSENKAGYGGGMFITGRDSTPVIRNTRFNNNQALQIGGGVFTSNYSSPSFDEVKINQNRAINGAGMHNQDSSPIIMNALFSGNTANYGGGAMSNNGSSSPILTNTTLTSNDAYIGGGLFNQDNSSPNLRNVLFTGNKAEFEGASISNDSPNSNIILTNVTISGDIPRYGESAIYGGDLVSKIQNTIIIGNSRKIAISNYKGKVENSLLDVQVGRNVRGKLIDGDGNTTDTSNYIPTDIFMDSSKKDYRLKVDSPAIDRGKVNYPELADVTTDIAGNKRIQGITIDLGVYEVTPFYSVIYDANEATAGQVPEDSAQYEENQTVTVQGNSGHLEKAGYTFVGWNTKVDGKGIAYKANDTFQIGTTNVILYAQWTKKQTATYTVTYDANEATGGQVPEDSAQYEENQTVTVQGNSGHLEKAGYTFVGWNTKADGKGIAYKANDTFQIGTTNVILYAQWTKKQTATYTVTYDANEATAGQVPEGSTRYEENQTVTVQGNSSHLERAGYTFVGWNTKIDGKGIAYKANDTFQIGTTNVILYAQWTKKQTATYTVTYDANEATAGQVPEDSTRYEENQTVTVQGNSGHLEKAGYTFVGWNTKVDGKGIAYKANVTFQIGTTNVILYAQWTKKQTATYTVTYDANEATAGQVPEIVHGMKKIKQ
ncbi:InlB B-repeat-containing protein [Lysinibacillus sp. FSL K6-0057]|uniref:InlB B-repeat-containing protein n=1 Tax=Lysinibacillus sp. FSL K6-0057 TaxID=2921411 RepID=UPI003159A207